MSIDLRQKYMASSRAMLIAGTVAGGSYFSYRFLFPLSPSGNLMEDECYPNQPSDDFAHPFDRKPLWWRFLLMSKRIIILAGCFAPFFAFSIMLLFTDSPEWRSVWMADFSLLGLSHGLSHTISGDDGSRAWSRRWKALAAASKSLASGFPCVQICFLPT
jgi:hypothetical protein